MTNENQKSIDSKLAFLEKATWKKGQEIITVLLTDENGRRQRVGHIYLEYQEKKKIFISCDAKGNELFPPAQNLFDLKKQFKGAEQELQQTLREQKAKDVRNRNTDRDNDKGIGR